MNYLKFGFISAGLANISGVLLFSKLFTNEAMNIAYPVVMSNFGLVMIIIWGLAYISVADHYKSLPWLTAVFVVEKLIYALTWVFWIRGNDLSALFSKDLFAGMFYTIYGLNDFVFMLFFGCVFFKTRKQEKG